MSADDLMPVVEVSRLVHASPERVRRLFHSGQLSGAVVGRQILVSRDGAQRLFAAEGADRAKRGLAGRG